MFFFNVLTTTTQPPRDGSPEYAQQTFSPLQTLLSLASLSEVGKDKPGRRIASTLGLSFRYFKIKFFQYREYYQFFY